MRCYLLGILALVIFVVFSATVAIGSKEQELVQSSVSSSALTGRLYEGLTNIPIAEGYIFALSLSKRTVLGWSMTLPGATSDSGRWQITGLPASGDVLLVGFHPSHKFNMAIQKFTLKGQHQDVGILTTDAAVHSSGPEVAGGLWDLLTLAGWIAQEINTKNANQEAINLASRLLRSAPGVVLIRHSYAMHDGDFRTYKENQTRKGWAGDNVERHSFNIGVTATREFWIRKCDILQEKIRGQKATVVVRLYRKNGSTVEETVPMVMENGFWKIAP